MESNEDARFENADARDCRALRRILVGAADQQKGKHAQARGVVYAGEHLYPSVGSVCNMSGDGAICRLAYCEVATEEAPCEAVKNLLPGRVGLVHREAPCHTLSGRSVAS